MMAPLRLPNPIVVLAAVALLLAGLAPLAAAHDIQDDVPRTAVVSAFAPELSILKDELADASTHSVNGVEFSVGTLQGQDIVLFLSGISVVNAAMTTQLALDHFNIELAAGNAAAVVKALLRALPAEA